jgi:hypothetical protein
MLSLYFYSVSWKLFVFSRAPDGTCILTNSNDHVLRIFNLPETVYEISKWGVKDNVLPPDIQEVVTIKEGGTIYDFCWYPCMTSLDPITCW